ncbi:MAG: PIN domain-containing protein [Gammaproteobacteria bacterium]|nr:PIN domain-containing protein [Gammaproteobacteria bacterium]
MKDQRAFFDTNVLLYLLSDDPRQADQAETLLVRGGVISVQVLNEFTSVAQRKLNMSYDEIGDVLQTILSVLQVEDLSVETHLLARAVVQRYRFSFYDALIVAAAVLADCNILYSEDMQSGQRIDDRLVIDNPFH